MKIADKICYFSFCGIKSHAREHNRIYTENKFGKCIQWPGHVSQFFSGIFHFLIIFKFSHIISQLLSLLALIKWLWQTDQGFISHTAHDECNDNKSDVLCIDLFAYGE